MGRFLDTLNRLLTGFTAEGRAAQTRQRAAARKPPTSNPPSAEQEAPALLHDLFDRVARVSRETFTAAGRAASAQRRTAARAQKASATEARLNLEAPFLQAIADTPEDDTPRLIFADWLEERGDPRCELIRLQCVPAPEKPDSPAEKQRRKAIRMWVLKHGAHWAGPINHLAHTWRYRRGFLEEITIAAATFLDNAEQLFRWAPLQSIHLLGAHLCWERVAECPFLARVSSLAFGTRRLDFNFEGEGHVALGPTSAGPISGHGFGDNGVTLLAASPHLGRLTHLDLGGCDVTDVGAEALAAAPNLAHLSVLQLAGNPITTEAQNLLRARFGDRVQFVRDASPLQNLKVTVLSSSNSDPSRDA